MALWWTQFDFAGTSAERSPRAEEYDSLEGLGYVSGRKKADDQEGILTHQEKAVHPGLNLYVSGHGPEANLITMDGEHVHRWRLSWSEAFPDTDPAQIASKYEDEDNRGKAAFWRKVHPYPNGDLLAIFSSLGIVKMNKNSDILWKKINKAHHDLDVGENGKIYLLTRYIKEKTVADKRYPYVDEKVTILSDTGVKSKEFSLVEALLKSRYSGIVPDLQVQSGEAFFVGEKLHSNSIDLIRERHKKLPSVFRPGNLIISLNKPMNIIVVDPSKEKVVWAMPTMAHAQHEANLLKNGNILFFNNNKSGTKKLDWSVVREVDPVTQEVVWSFQGDESNGMYSRCCSTNQRLPNGNTLITETEDGRAFEVTESGDIVWEFRSPHRVTKDGEKKIAQLFEVERLPANYMENW